MKKISSVIFLSFLVLFLLVTPVIGSDDWVKWSEYDNGNIRYYKIRNINKDRGKYIVQVWDKVVLSDKGKDEDLQMRINEGFSTKKSDRVSEIMFLYKIDCKKQKIQTLSTIWYSEDGGRKYSSDDNPKWEYITPDSCGEGIQEKVCK